MLSSPVALSITLASEVWKYLRLAHCYVLRSEYKLKFTRLKMSEPLALNRLICPTHYSLPVPPVPPDPRTP